MRDSAEAKPPSGCIIKPPLAVHRLHDLELLLKIALGHPTIILGESDLGKLVCPLLLYLHQLALGPAEYAMAVSCLEVRLCHQGQAYLRSLARCGVPAVELADLRVVSPRRKLVAAPRRDVIWRLRSIVVVRRAWRLAKLGDLVPVDPLPQRLRGGPEHELQDVVEAGGALAADGAPEEREGRLLPLPPGARRAGPGVPRTAPRGPAWARGGILVALGARSAGLAGLTDVEQLPEAPVVRAELLELPGANHARPPQ
mmetsp:Transcript_100436/g.312997  ORF Transcript_100436/g.312997 Transcript_100436/m.312997 type:complete len:256 (-) Transcript_100436:772-1539(-)